MVKKRKIVVVTIVLAFLTIAVVSVLFFKPQLRILFQDMGILERETIKLPIIMYHHFDKNEEIWGEATMPPEQFSEHLAAIKDAGYTTVTYQELYEYVNGYGGLPEKPVIITIDDGYYSNYEYAFEFFKELDMKAVISIIGWSVGETEYKDKSFKIFPHFTWEQAKEMSESGLVEIASHTYDLHENGQMLSPRNGCEQLPGESDTDYYKALYDDYKKMYDMISENVEKPLVLTYPYGIHTEISEKAAADAGYKITVSTDAGINYLKRRDGLTVLKRYNIPYGMSVSELLAILEG